MTDLERDQEKIKVIGFWKWLFEKNSSTNLRGISNIINIWLLFHLIAAIILAFIFKAPASEISKSAALPGAAALIGLAFGWAGRSTSLLQEKNFSEFIINYGPPAEGYIYSFQLAILSVIIFISIALALTAGGFGISLGNHTKDELANKFILFFFGSIAARESWGIVLFANKLTIKYYKIKEMSPKAPEERDDFIINININHQEKNNSYMGTFNIKRN